MTRIALVLIRAYQVCLSPFCAPACRFFPTCSDYAAQAIARHGFRHGVGMALRRLSRCHPWHPGGYDPVKEPHA